MNLPVLLFINWDKMYINSTLYAEKEYIDVADVVSQKYFSFQEDCRLPETQGSKVSLHLSLIFMNTILVLQSGKEVRTFFTPIVSLLGDIGES